MEGTEIACDAGAVGRSCEWIEVLACTPGMTLGDFCERSVVTRLRRCDGSCFRPDSPNRAYRVCSCEARQFKPGEPPPCECDGTSWAAVYCCFKW